MTLLLSGRFSLSAANHYGISPIPQFSRSSNPLSVEAFRNPFFTAIKQERDSIRELVAVLLKRR